MVKLINNVNLSLKTADSVQHAKNQTAVEQYNNSYKTPSFNGKREARYFLRWLSKNFSSPQQRALIGISALCTQPFIDLHNKHIKKEDKSVVVAKTIAKIIVGTCVGIAVRHYAIKAVKQFTKTINSGKYSQCLLPTHILEKLKTNPKLVSEKELMNYRNGLGTFLGIMCGLVTNFTIDAPLSKKLTNLINEKVFTKEKANVK